jgi:O-antigen/teichoic acid export membrane protein
LAVAAPAKSPDVRRLMIGSVEQSQRRFLRPIAALALVVPVAGYFFKVWSGLTSLVIGMGVFAGWTALLREYMRGALLIYSRPQSMLHADIYYAAVLLGGASVAAFGPKPAVVWAALALVASAWIGGHVARRSIAHDPGWISGDSAPFLREMRPIGIWSTIGAVIYWLFSQSYNYVLATRVDLTAVADVNAARLLLMPTIVLTVGVKTLLGPSAAAWLAEAGLHRLLRRLLVFLAGIAALDFIYFAVLWLSRNWVTQDLMHKFIADRDRLLLLWAVVALIGLTRDLLQTALFALRRMQALAWLTGASAVVSLSLMWYGITRFGPAGALIAQIAGESVNLLGVVVLLAMAYRQLEPSKNHAVIL